jgi:ribosomal protein S27AE
MPYNTPEKKKNHNQRYYKQWYVKNGRERSINYREVIDEWRKKHPEAVFAKLKVAKALKNGLIIKPKKCSKCGRITRLNGHHPDYSKPLEVLWVCGSCHKLIHGV